MVKIGNFLFHYRNALFPVVYALLFLPGPPLLGDSRIAALIGFGVAFAGQLLRAVTVGLEYIKRGGQHKQVYAAYLVQGGMFAHCRNPLYVGNFLILIGLGIASNSALFLAVAIPFFTFAYAAIIAAEENYLRNKFGQEFTDYCARVNRLLPRLSGIGQTLQGMRFNWRQLITKEYGSAYAWLAAMILITFKNIWVSGQLKSSPGLVWTLGLLLFLSTIGYAIARYLKKNRLLIRDAQPTAATSP